MENKLKGIMEAIIVLGYIITLGYLILNIKDDWLYLLNIILLGIGFYCFVEKNSN